MRAYFMRMYLFFFFFFFINTASTTGAIRGIKQCQGDWIASQPIRLQDAIIRPANLSDLESLLTFEARMWEEFWISLFEKCYTACNATQFIREIMATDLEKIRMSWPTILASQQEERLTAAFTPDGSVLGLVLSHYDQTNKIVTIDLLEVGIQHQGKGFGKDLIAQACSYFPDATKVQLYVITKNEGAINFYIALGFVNKGPSKIPGVNGFNIPYKNMYCDMERKLPFINQKICSVRLATAADLPGIFALDRICTYSHFKQSFQQGFPTLSISDNNLEAELATAQREWPRIVATQTTQKIHVAHDNKNQLCGFVVSYEQPEKKAAVIALLEVAQSAQHQGVGSALVNAACTSYSTAHKAIVYPLQQGNDLALRFYEKLGFINKGKAPTDRINHYGISYDRMYYCYERSI
jgi:ribosomal protein S18 acetylase RimI-like enzyme